MEEKKCEGTEEEETPKSWFTSYVRNPEKYPDCITDLIGGAATQSFAPGVKHLRAATDYIVFAACPV